MHTCRRCGTPNRPGRNHCIACGEPLEGPAQPPGQTLPGPGGPASGGTDQAPPEPSPPKPSPPKSSPPSPPTPAQPAPAQPMRSHRGRTLLGIPQRTPGRPAPGTSPPAPPPDLSSRPPEAPEPLPSPEAGSPAPPPSDGGQPDLGAPETGAALPRRSTPSPTASSGPAPSASAPGEAPASAPPNGAPPEAAPPAPPPVSQPAQGAAAPEESSPDPGAPALEPLTPPVQPLPPEPAGGPSAPAPTEAFFPPPRPGQQRTSLIPARAPGAVEPTIPPDSSPGAPTDRRRSRRWVLLAAVLVLLVGGAGAGLALWRAQPPSSSPAPALPFRTEVLVDVTPDATQVPAVDVLTPPGAQVRIEGVRIEGVQLDLPESPGAAQATRTRHHLELPEEAVGEAADVEVTGRSVSIEVELPSGETASTELTVSLPVSPLQLTTPGPRWVLDPGLLLVRGTTSPGARVQAGDSRVRADDQGNFLLPVPTKATGVLTVRSTAPGEVTRRVQVQVVDRATLPPPTAFTELTSGTDTSGAHTSGGEPRRVRITGKVTEARQEAEGVLLVLEVTQGCTSKAPCRVEVLHPVRLDPARLRSTSSRDQGPSYGPGRQLDVVGELLSSGARPRLLAEALVPR